METLDHYIVANRYGTGWNFTCYSLGGEDVASGTMEACFAAQRLLTGECERALETSSNLRGQLELLSAEVSAVLKANNMELG